MAGKSRLSKLFSWKKRDEATVEQEIGDSSPALLAHVPPLLRSNSGRVISRPIPTSGTSLTGFDNPYIANAPSGSTNDLRHYPFTSQAQLENSLYLAYSAPPAPRPETSSYGGFSTPPARLLTPADHSSRNVQGVSPAVIRIETDTPQSHVPAAQPVRRSLSSPVATHPSPTESISSAEITPTAFSPPGASHNGKWNLKLQTNTAPSGSTYSFPTMNTDVYSYAYGYPQAKQLSPIPEQDYFSPISLKKSQSLPGTPSREANISSPSSELTRPSPSYSSPFLTRPLNRTTSQGSSRTYVSTAKMSGKSIIDTPVIPPLDLRPPFPGPHPNPNGMAPFPRPPRYAVLRAGSDIMEEDYEATTHDSLHADSFVTANSQTPIQQPPPSVSESFITRRWDRDAELGTGVRTFVVKKQSGGQTPAFWLFWLGFMFPVLWLVGGWHFTNLGEQPPRLTFWEFYFNSGFWKHLVCGKRDKKRDMREGRKSSIQSPPLPRWVTEKQDSEDGRARLNDPKRSLKGISFGYPFISRAQLQSKDCGAPKAAVRVLEVLGKANTVFDQFYGVKLREVQGRPESQRRCFDPWIQRCRYALCYAFVLFALGLCIASAYLIVYNTRGLRD